MSFVHFYNAGAISGDGLKLPVPQDAKTTAYIRPLIADNKLISLCGIAMDPSDYRFSVCSFKIDV